MLNLSFVPRRKCAYLSVKPGLRNSAGKESGTGAVFVDLGTSEAFRESIGGTGHNIGLLARNIGKRSQDESNVGDRVV